MTSYTKKGLVTSPCGSIGTIIAYLVVESYVPFVGKCCRKATHQTRQVLVIVYIRRARCDINISVSVLKPQLNTSTIS